MSEICGTKKKTEIIEYENIQMARGIIIEELSECRTHHDNPSMSFIWTSVNRGMLVRHFYWGGWGAVSHRTLQQPHIQVQEHNMCLVSVCFVLVAQLRLVIMLCIVAQSKLINNHYTLNSSRRHPFTINPL
jgi:hypothetical protein